MFVRGLESKKGGENWEEIFKGKDEGLRQGAAAVIIPAFYIAIMLERVAI